MVKNAILVILAHFSYAVTKITRMQLSSLTFCVMSDMVVDMTAYDDLLAKSKEITLLNTAAGVVNWDLETYMPPKGIQLRSEQLAALGQIIHRSITSPEIGKLLESAEKEADSNDEVMKRNLYLTRRVYDEFTKLPEELVAAIAKQQAISVDTWKKAKAAKDWKMFVPELQKMIDLSIKKAEALEAVKGTSGIYNTMIDDFEPKMSSDDISRVFDELRKGLIPITKKYAEFSAEVDTSFLSTSIPTEIQRKIVTNICDILQYDTTSDQAGGRIDEVEHPFTAGFYDDVRITVKYHENSFSSAMYATLHEAGHALYEQNLNRDWMYQPIGSSSSAGIHESMSRFYENMIGRSPEFLKFYLPKLKKYSSGAFSDIDENQFTKAMNLVTPSKIRIEADEVTYALHIIIRFEIERDLFAGKISVSELPQVWNEKYKEYLGMDIKDDSEGVMQDTHWASGYYGYFPSYALGNVFDGMWLSKLNKDLPDWLGQVSEGSIGSINQWLAENIMVKSDLLDPQVLAEQVTGMKLTAAPFIEYLEKKYTQLFES
jgi:carboxypeptidase Taq